MNENGKNIKTEYATKYFVLWTFVSINLTVFGTLLGIVMVVNQRLEERLDKKFQRLKADGAREMELMHDRLNYRGVYRALEDIGEDIDDGDSNN